MFKIAQQTRFISCFFSLFVFSVVGFAQCNGKEIFQSHHHAWHSIKNTYAPVTREAIVFEDFRGGLVKLPREHKHPKHYYKHKLLVVITEGHLQITANGKTSHYRKGDYFVVPAYTCFSSYSKNGASLVLAGAVPGNSYPAKN